MTNASPQQKFVWVANGRLTPGWLSLACYFTTSEGRVELSLVTGSSGGVFAVVKQAALVSPMRLAEKIALCGH